MENAESFGFININKPKGMSSHNIVYIVRKLLGIKQVGHSGTLDPLATGVLVIGVGRATRLFEFLKEEKEYIATIKFGYDSDTLDVEGECIKKEDFFPEEKSLKKILKEFLGESEQIPPKYSAIKVGGKKLYELARKGEEIGELKPRLVNIKEVELIDIDGNLAKIRVKCSKGTYVRSLIRDIAQKLGTCAVMSDLIRTKSGVFNIENSLKLNEYLEKSDLENSLINPLEILEYKKLELKEVELKKVKNGMPVEINPSKEYTQGETVVLTYENQLISVGNVIGNKILQKKVLL